MELIMEVCGAMLLVSGAVVALTIATIFAYVTAVLIKSSIEDRKKSKKTKKAKKNEKK